MEDEDPLDEQEGEPLVDLEDLGDMLKGNNSNGKKSTKKVPPPVSQDIVSRFSS